MAYNDKRRQKRRKKLEDRVADVNRTRGPRPTGPVKYAAPAPVGVRQPGQPIISPEMGKAPALGGGGSMRVPERSSISGKGYAYDPSISSRETSDAASYATFPPPSEPPLFPNEGPLRNAPPSSTSQEALRRRAQQNGFLTNGKRLAPDASLRSGISTDDSMSRGTRDPLRDMGVSSDIIGKPQPTSQYYGSMVAPGTAAGVGTVVSPGQEDSVVRQRMREQLTRPANLPLSDIAEDEANKREAAAIAGRVAGLRNDINNMSTSRNRNDLFSSVTGDTDMSNYGEVSAFRSGGGGFPTIPTTPEARLQSRERQARAGTGDPLSAAEQSQLSEFMAQSYAREQGLPYIPPSAPAAPREGRRAFPDIRAGELDSNESGLRIPSTVNRVTAPDGRQVTFGQGNGQGAPMQVENGNIMMTDTDGTRRAVVLPSSGYSLGLRTAEVDSQGNFIPGTFRTQSDQARREERQDMAIARGNAPGASPEEVVAGQQAQSAKDKFAAYKKRRADRRSSALDIRREANAMRSYGPIGQQFMGLQGGAMGQVSPVFATRYGQTGPSLSQAAGMVRQQRAAQERMDEAMKRQQERESKQRRQELLQSAYNADPNDPRLQDALQEDLGLRDRTTQEQSRYDRDQFNLRMNNMVQGNEITMDPRQIPGAGVGDLDNETRSMLAAGIDDVLKSDQLTDEEREILFRNVDLDVVADLIDRTAWDQKYWEGERSEKLYKDFEAYLRRTGQLEDEGSGSSRPGGSLPERGQTVPRFDPSGEFSTIL